MYFIYIDKFLTWAKKLLDIFYFIYDLMKFAWPNIPTPPPPAKIGDDALATSCCSNLSDTDTPTAGSESSTAPEDWPLRPGASRGNNASITAGITSVCWSSRRPWKETTALPNDWSPLHKWIWKQILKSQQAKQDIGITKRFYGEEKQHKGTLLTSSRLFLNIKSLIDKTHGIDGKAILKHYYYNTTLVQRANN